MTEYERALERHRRARRYYRGRQTYVVLRSVRQRLVDADASDAVSALDRLSDSEAYLLAQREISARS